MTFLCVFSVESNAQNDLLNQKKYWYYHHRLVQDFMVKGDCKGCSLPMTERNYQNESKGQWADATISLGNYISVLASEYKLLKNNNQPTDTTLQELCLAIKAFNRLDQTAESYFRCATCPPTPLPGDLNGFFIRDDVDEYFLFNHPQIKTAVVSEYNINVINSDLVNYLVPTDKEMSHDQIWHLFIGFALVSELLDDIPISHFPLNEVDGNTDIRQEAKNITDRIMNHVRNQDGPLYQRWVIMNPITNIHVDRGWQVGELSYGAAEAACFIRNGNTNLDLGYPAHTCNEYHDAFSYTASSTWHLAGLGIGSIVAFWPEDNKVQNLAAVGSSWRASETPLLALNVTAERLAARAILRDYQHLMLVHQVLHGQTNPIEQATYLNLLNTAPCKGPYNFSYPDNSASFEWSTENRLLYPQRRGEDNDGLDKNAFKGEYNGLDYMLYHNLYYIINGIPSQYFNYMDIAITYPFPTGPSNDIGTLTSPITIEAFHTITASNTINNNADVTYRAGKEIALVSDFEVKAGANFHAFIDPFECSTDGEYRSSSNNSNDSSLAPSENLVAYNGPTTHVLYPSSRKPSLEKTNVSSLEHSSPLKNLNNEISITPNPNNGSFQISLTHDNKFVAIKKLKVYDIMGKIIWKTDVLSNSINVDITSYAAGIYYVKCTNELGEMEMKKLIKQ